ncbi:MAG: DUF819 family protein [Parvularculaceae bacterium]
MVNSIIGPDAHFTIAAVLLAVTAFGYWMERTDFGKRFSSVLPVLIAAAVLSNAGLIPKSAPVYNAVWSYLIPLSIPLLLFKADLRRVWKETGPTMIAFLAGAVGVLLGAFLSYAVLPLGDDGPAFVGLYSATYIGGSLNFAAVANSIGYTDATKLTAAIAVDNVIGISFLVLLIVLPSFRWFARLFPEKDHASEETAELHSARAPLDFLQMSTALAISMGVCVVSIALARKLGMEPYAILFITFGALLLANLFPKKFAALSGDFELGMFFLLIFFATTGAGIDIMGMVRSAGVLAVMTTIIMAVHSVVLFAAGRFFRLSLEEIIIGSNACILGAPTAAAQAASREWRALVTPGILCGLFGNAIANFIGVGLFDLLSRG